MIDNKKVFFSVITPGSVNYASAPQKKAIIELPFIKDILRGTVLVLTSGEYSDYYLCGVYEVLKDIPLQNLREGWFKDHPDQYQPYRFKDDEFRQHLEDLKYIKRLDSRELNMYYLKPQVRYE